METFIALDILSWAPLSVDFGGTSGMMAADWILGRGGIQTYPQFRVVGCPRSDMMERPGSWNGS
jgi:hypothetical protein